MLATSRRKIDAFGVVVNCAWQAKPAGVTGGLTEIDVPR
jgi:hypothetical protein